MKNPTKWLVCPAKTLINLGNCLVWSVFAIRMKKHWALNYLLSTQWRLWSDWCPGWSVCSLGARHFAGFVLQRLKLSACGTSWNRVLVRLYVLFPPFNGLCGGSMHGDRATKRQWSDGVREVLSSSSSWAICFFFPCDIWHPQRSDLLCCHLQILTSKPRFFFNICTSMFSLFY